MTFDFQEIMFLELPQKEITIESIREFMEDEATKRINFASSHANALKRTGEKKVGKIILPFGDSINPILKNATDCILFKSKFDDRFYRRINDEDEYNKFERFVSLYKDVVFLRDNLDLSIALSMNYEGNERTEIGELEYQAKFNNDEDSESQLVDICKKWIEELPYYKHADYICAMPSSNPDEESLPERIVNLLTDFNFINISEKVFWLSKTRNVKDAEDVEEKLEILEESNLTIAEDLDFNGKTVILFDDLYMSGISMQYVAMKLKKAGANRVLGLSIVKSRSNTAR